MGVMCCDFLVADSIARHGCRLVVVELVCVEFAYLAGRHGGWGGLLYQHGLHCSVQLYVVLPCAETAG